MLARIAPDQELLAAYANGDESAFETLYKRYRRRLWGLAKKMAWDTQQAEDILVEAMAAVSVQAKRGAIKGSFIGYSLTAVHHRGLHVLERRNERNARKAVELKVSLRSDSPTPEQSLMKRALRDEVSQALDELPKNESTAVYLVDCQGLTYKEAAAALACSEATVKRRLREGRRTLALKLAHLRPGRRPSEEAEGAAV
ncbi:MAG: sigma-70 family RNA polymerase sigma factor [Deltaproteobacteria bacterium]|nr:sigma-70 family RNA polymerase sigma factor [Deltaproteobacteria bacterium]